MRPSNIPTAILALVLTAVLVTPALAQPPIVTNGAQPANGIEKMQLEEQWRIGGPDDEENFFGLITWAEADAEGLLYVLDAQMCQALVYDQEASWSRPCSARAKAPVKCVSLVTSY